MVRFFRQAAVIATLCLACTRGALQPDDMPSGAAGTSGAAGLGGAGGNGGSPVDDADGGPPGNPNPACQTIATSPGVFNPCGRTYAIAFSSDGQLLATGTATERPNVHIWRLSDGAHLRDIDGIGANLYGLSFGIPFTPSDGLLATAGGYWQGGGSLHEEPQVVKLWSVADGALIRTIPAHCGSYATTAAFSHDGTLLLTAGAQGPVEVWRVFDGSLVTTISYPTTVHNAHFSPTDREVITGGVDRRATVWSLPTGNMMMLLDGIADEMADAAFSPDGAEIATTGANNDLVVWNSTTGAVRQTLSGHAAFVSHVVWIGRDRLVSNDWMGTVKSWTRVGAGDFALSGGWTTGGQSLGIAVSPDGKQLVAGGADANGVEGFVFLAL